MVASQPYDARRARRDRLVTKEFRGLQGYKLLPWVPAMLLWWGSEAAVLEGDWWLWAFLASLVAAAAGTWVVGRWYDRTYGKVHRRSNEDVTQGVWALVLAVTIILVVLIGFSIGGRVPFEDSPQAVSWGGAMMGLAWAIMGWRMRPLTASTWWFGVALALLSVIPIGLLAPFDGQHPFSADGALMGVLAVFVVVVGIASHRALDRALASAPPASTTSRDEG